jgi:GTP-binding protein Era
MTTRCGVIAIIGAPNAGKSTLVNRLVGEKVAIVTHKVQTTRTPLRGIAVRGETQLVLIDTPGVFEPSRRLERAMVRAAWGALEGADAIVHIVDASAMARHAAKSDEARHSKADPNAETPVARLISSLRKSNRTAILALNKIDAMPREALLEIADSLNAEGIYTDTFMISALTGDGVQDLMQKLLAVAPEGPWLFPEDQIADAPARVMAAEITREKLMLRLHQELPYQATVETDAWEERKDGSVKIEQIIYVARESQRKIAIGEKGQTVKAIGEAARKELEKGLGRRVHLFLHVKVRENWAEERARYAALGLDWDA